MNVFATYADPVRSAQSLDDQRVIKMVTESYQMLSTAARSLGYRSSLLYKSTHANHPCAVWCRTKRENFEWLYEHMMALDAERIRRWGREEHTKAAQRATEFRIIKIRSEIRPGWTEWANCARNVGLGIDFTHLPVHEAYRKYLLARWQLQQSKFEKPGSRSQLPKCTVVGLLR